MFRKQQINIYNLVKPTEKHIKSYEILRKTLENIGYLVQCMENNTTKLNSL